MVVQSIRENPISVLGEQGSGSLDCRLVRERPWCIISSLDNPSTFSLTVLKVAVFCVKENVVGLSSKVHVPRPSTEFSGLSYSGSSEEPPPLERGPESSHLFLL